jgi:hypothetical protein
MAGWKYKSSSAAQPGILIQQYKLLLLSVDCSEQWRTLLSCCDQVHRKCCDATISIYKRCSYQLHLHHQITKISHSINAIGPATSCRLYKLMECSTCGNGVAEQETAMP